MENVLFISDPSYLEKYHSETFTRVYFGNEFCERQFPAPEQISYVMDFTKKHGLDFTLVTPVIHESYLEKFLLLLDILPGNIEVVFNDWGLLSAIAERKLTPVHGRVLCSVKKDPGIITGTVYDDYLKSHNLNARYQDFLMEHGIYRVELDNVIQGYNLELHKKISASIYYPHVQCTITRKCIFANINEKDNKLKIALSCGNQCSGRHIETRIIDNEIFIAGNAQYYINNRKPDQLPEWNVDRMVYTPVFPNRNKRGIPGG